MKVLVNDHGGYPFPLQLSKELASKGHTIIHCYSQHYEGPRGNVENNDSNLKIIPIAFRKFKKYSVTDRVKYEANYCDKVIDIINKNDFDIVICANNPLVSQDKIQKHCIAINVKFILWCHDIRSIAITKFLAKKNFLASLMIGKYFRQMEKRHLKNSDAIINITDDFNDIFKKWGIPADKFYVIPNWAPLNELPVIPKNNDWSIAHKLNDKFCVLYSGTLGLKHNPQILIDLAIHFRDLQDVRIVVVSEGKGIKLINEAIKKNNLDNLVVFPFQDFKDLPLILGSADVLVAVLEEDAGIFSVPSKVLTYLCAQRPIVLSVPDENLSSRIVRSANAGLCAPPGRIDLVIDAIKGLYENPDEAKSLGANGRVYAENNFDISEITAKFESIFQKLHPLK